MTWSSFTGSQLSNLSLHVDYTTTGNDPSLKLQPFTELVARVSMYQEPSNLSHDPCDALDMLTDLGQAPC
jgi:hypothetical protein